MELFELRYFLAVAKHENIHRASEELHISPGSLSKAVARLEEELGVKLFGRVNRNIQLNHNGVLLQKRARDIVALEESAKIELFANKDQLHIRIAGSELLLALPGVELVQKFRDRFQHCSFDFIGGDNTETIERIEKGEAHLGVVTGTIPTQLTAKKILAVEFQTCVGRGHPLYKIAKSGKSIDIYDLLKHEFIVPSQSVLGPVQAHQSLDGWRDDKFPRRVRFVSSSLRLIEQMVVTGAALAYLPDYYATQIDVVTLNITGCPFICKQDVSLIARNPKHSSWLNFIF